MKHKFTLIDGKFFSSDAAQLLQSLLRYKIDYHEMALLSEEERFNMDVSNSKKRIEELNKVDDAIREIVKRYANTDKILKISSFIEIEVQDQ